MRADVRAGGDRPTICLSMIVRDEEHVIRETLDSVAGHIDHWVIVDTGSVDATIATVTSHMAGKGIPGEIHERPWRDFGSNRTEALELCAGKADYAWVIDADDLVVGDLDLSHLVADSYMLRYGDAFSYWRKQIFRDGLRWSYEGVVHEYARCPDPVSEARLEGAYHLESRRLGSRSQDPEKYRRDATLLERDLDRDPANERTVFYLAQSLFDAGEIASALERYTQRSQMAGWDEERYVSLWRRAECLEALEESWSAALHAYLEAWAARPTRAEPLHAIARHFRSEDSFELGYLFAARACEIPFPDGDDLFVGRDVYDWRARDEKAICAFYVDRREESFELCNELLEGDALPDSERDRVQTNRDLCVPGLLAVRERYPKDVIAGIIDRQRNEDAAAKRDVTLTITSCRRLSLFERTVNSFLGCCTDLDRIGRWICVDNGSNSSDRDRMRELYPFFEFVFTEPEDGERHPESMNRIVEMVDDPFWLHLEDDWGFFWRGPYLARAVDVLAEDGSIGQVAFNPSYAESLEGRRIDAGEVRRTAGGGKPYRLHEYVERGDRRPAGPTMTYWPHFTLRPSLIRTRAIDSIRRFEPWGHFELEAARRYADAGNRTAFFDQVVCLHLGRRTWEVGPSERPSAYELVGDGSHPAHQSGSTPSPPSLDVAVLNLDRRPDRWERFEEMAQRTTRPDFRRRLRRASAVDGRELTLNPELEHLFRGNDFGLRRGIVGCALSHMEQWRSLAAEQDGLRLILEDDVELVDDFDRPLGEVLDRLRREHPDFAVAFLGHLTTAQSTSEGELELRPMAAAGFVGGSYAYLLSPSGARRLLEIAERCGVQNGIDVFVARQAAELRMVECVPAIAHAEMAQPGDTVDSDVQRDFTPVAVDAADDPISAPEHSGTLAGLAPSCAVAEVRIEAPTDWRCGAVTAVATPDGYSLELLAADAGLPDYVATLTEALEVRSLAPLSSPSERGSVATAVALDDGVLTLTHRADSAHRFELADAGGHRVAASPEFTLTKAGGESCTGLAEREGELVIAFVTGSGVAMIASLELEDAISALQR